MKQLLLALVAGAVFLSACSSEQAPTSTASGTKQTHKHHHHHKAASGANNLK